MALSDYPKESSALLTQEEKVLLDHMPNDVIKSFLSELEGQTNGTFTGITNDGVFKLVFEGEDRMQAVRDYFEMLFEFGVRERPVDGGN
jgi:hypothetical protein